MKRIIIFLAHFPTELAIISQILSFLCSFLPVIFAGCTSCAISKRFENRGAAGGVSTKLLYFS